MFDSAIYTERDQYNLWQAAYQLGRRAGGQYGAVDRSPDTIVEWANGQAEAGADWTIGVAPEGHDLDILDLAVRSLVEDDNEAAFLAGLDCVPLPELEVTPAHYWIRPGSGSEPSGPYSLDEARARFEAGRAEQPEQDLFIGCHENCLSPVPDASLLTVAC